MRLTDTSKNFTTLGVAFGDFVRVGSATAPSKWAMVRSVDGSNLDVDRGWFDSNYEPTLPPAPGDTYYVLQTVLGRITSQNVADSKLTVERWYRLNGSTAPTPAADTRFELLMNNDNAPPTGSVQAETYSRVHLVGCYTRGNLSDQFALGGDDCSVIDCEAEYGRDMGLTINGSRTTVVGGRYTRNGAGGIYVGNPGAELPGGGDVRIVGVSSRGNGVEAFGTSFPGGNNCDLFLDGARARVIGCHFDKASGPEIHAVVTTSNAPNALLTGCTAVGGYATPSVLNGGPSTTITDSVGLTV
jgi:hypothetical protein